MDRPSRIVLVRHAESLRNEAKRGATYFADDTARSTIRGIPDQDVDITTLGRHQATVTGQALALEYPAFDYAYHSGYLRTKATLDLILKQYPDDARSRIKVRENLFIRERHSGYAYDMTEPEARQTFPYLKEYWETFGGFYATPPGGESLATVTERVYAFLNMLFRDRIGESILVVTHGGTLRCFRYLLERWTSQQAISWPRGQAPKNCSVTAYAFDPVLRRLNLQYYNRVHW